MTLKLYMHPLSSFCHKVLVALYENGTSFEPVIVDFSNPDSRAAFVERSPRGKMLALHDIEANVALPESSIIIEYIHTHYQGPAELLRKGVEEQLEVRLWDRFFDLYIHQSMQRIAAERLRPKDAPDPHGLSEAHATIEKAYGVLEQHLAGHEWVAGKEFSMADCSAVPALFYGSIVHPFSGDLKNTSEYFERLVSRPSVKRVIEEARPYFQYFPTRKRCRHVSCKVDCIIRSRFLKETACLFPTQHLPPSSGVATVCCWCGESIRHRRTCSPFPVGAASPARHRRRQHFANCWKRQASRRAIHSFSPPTICLRMTLRDG